MAMEVAGMSVRMGWDPGPRAPLVLSVFQKA